MTSILRQRMLDAMVLSGKAARTQEAYIGAVFGLARHYHRSPDALTADNVQHYLLHLLRERHLSRSSVNQYGCAFRFLYGRVLGLDGQTFESLWPRRHSACPRSSRARRSRPCSSMRRTPRPVPCCAAPTRWACG